MIIKEVTCAYKRIQIQYLFTILNLQNITLCYFYCYCQNRNRNIQANQTAEHCIRNYFPSPQQFGYIQLEIVVSILAVFLSHLHSNKNKQLSKHTYSVQDHLRLLKNRRTVQTVQCMVAFIKSAERTTAKCILYARK